MVFTALVTNSQDMPFGTLQGCFLKGRLKNIESYESDPNQMPFLRISIFLYTYTIALSFPSAYQFRSFVGEPLRPCNCPIL
jgi:hypothetical protein